MACTGRKEWGWRKLMDIQRSDQKKVRISLLRIPIFGSAEKRRHRRAFGLVPHRSPRALIDGLEAH